MTGREDTIVAIATGVARGGIGVVRLSGPKAPEIAREIFNPLAGGDRPWPSHQLLYGEILGGDGERIDDGFAVRMVRPNSYTGEEVVEIHGHGSPVTLQQIVFACVSQGARLAEPGEFTKRAFLNGRIDLIQAEAVAELIRAESEAEARAAKLRLEGKLSETVRRLREETRSLLVDCEAAVDFPEEGTAVPRPALLEKISSLLAAARDLRSSYAANQRLTSGFSVALLGRPNVGKSSLFNALLKTDRAIVTPTPGTTRDALREELVLSGVRARLIDTAGFHDSPKDDVERIGIRKAEEAQKQADLHLFICDASEGLTRQEAAWLTQYKDIGPWLVWNKTDLRRPASEPAPLPRLFWVSALRGDGVSSLREAIGAEAARACQVGRDGGVSNDRQRELLDEFLDALSRADGELQADASPEFAAFELQRAYRGISRLLGEDEGMEEVLSEIFSRFCIGK